MMLTAFGQARFRHNRYVRRKGSMADKNDATAWLLMSVGDDRQHGGNSGYDDRADQALDRVAHRAHNLSLPQGHQIEIVQIWRGKRQFRERLLSASGEISALR
jgi:hypothetical protein